MKELVLVLLEKDKAYLGGIRCYPNIQIALDEEFIWIKGINSSENLDLEIRKLPAKNTYILDDKNNLFPPGGLTPTGKLKELNWLPVNQFIQPEFPVSLMPGKSEQTYFVKL